VIVVNKSPKLWIWTIVAWVLVIGSMVGIAAGWKYRNEERVTVPKWPKGLDKLANYPNRIDGFCLNAWDIFFFAGNASNLTAFLTEYSRLEGIDGTRLVLHNGIGTTKSAFDKIGQPCDWKLYTCPKGWHEIDHLIRQGTNSFEVLRKAGQQPGYVVEVHFWTGGSIRLDQLVIPKNVEIWQ
jgi:hypothetical protein